MSHLVNIHIYTQNIHEYILYLDNFCFLGSNGGVNFAPWWHHSVHPVFTPCSPDRQRSFQFGKWRARTRQNLGRWTAAGLRSYRRRPHLMLLIAMLHLWWIYLLNGMGFSIINLINQLICGGSHFTQGSCNSICPHLSDLNPAGWTHSRNYVSMVHADTIPSYTIPWGYRMLTNLPALFSRMPSVM